MGGLHQRGYGDSGNDGGGGTGSSKIDEEGPHWQPQMKKMWEKEGEASRMAMGLTYKD